MPAWLSPAKRSKVAAKSYGRCWYCGKRLRDDAETSVDHIIPKVKGGDNSLENLVLACRLCNTLKGARTIEQFRVFMTFRNCPLKPEHFQYIEDSGGYCPMPPEYVFWFEEGCV